MRLLLSLINLTFIIIICCTTITNCLYEDQVGKFDWHQKYFGHVSFILNDVSQPKRILIGAKNNVIGAVNSNTGSILYRVVLEANGELKYLGNYEKKLLVAISSWADLTKVRTFESATGVNVGEWAFPSKITYATEFDSKAYLVNAESKLSEISITTVLLDDESSSNRIPETKKVNIGLPDLGTCATVSQFLVCAHKGVVAIVDLAEGSVSRKKLDDGFEVREISTSGPGPIPCIALVGEKTFQIFHILENQKNGPELMPVSYLSASKYVRLSQGDLDDEPVLFISSLQSPQEITVEIFGKNLEKLSGQELKIRSAMPIASLEISKGFCISSRCAFVGFTKDESLFGTKVEAKGTSGKQSLNIEWTRQEALGSVLAVEMVDYPSEIGPSWNPYMAQLDVITAFVSRIKYEVESLVFGESLYASAQDRFGLRKIIVLVSSVGKVVGMDSTTGSILYSFLLPDFSLLKESTVFLYIQRPAKFAPLQPFASVIYRSSNSATETTILYQFNPVDGKPLDQPQTYPPILQTQMLLHGTEETKFLKPILMMDVNHIVHSYPPNIPEVTNSYFFLAQKGFPSTLRGYSIRPSSKNSKLQGMLLWELSLGNGDLLGVHGKLLGERVHSQGRVLPDRSVSYKYMNPNLIVAVTAEHEAGNINIFLIDAVSGTVIHSLWHKKCRGPVHVVHSEHWLVYSLFNEKSRRYEINSIELYEGQSQSNSSAFSSFATPFIQPIVVKQAYVFPTGIQQMAHTRTEKGITNKDVLIALPSGAVLELPKMILQPRLSQQHYVQQVHDEDGVIVSMPYIPELPVPAEMIINYNQSVSRINGIKTWPTRLESTCLVLVHGLDLFYTRVTPSKTFDVLKDDFDHWFITVVLAALVAGAYIAKRFSARKQLEQAWR